MHNLSVLCRTLNAFFMKNFLFLCIRILLYTLVIAVTLITAGFIYYYATLYAAEPAQKGYLALTQATVLAGEDLVPLHKATVLIRNGVIEGVGYVDEIEIPPGAAVFDLTGYTLMPGLIDMHVHMGTPAIEAGQEQGWMMMPSLIADWIRFSPGRRRALLNHGVTSVRSLGDEYEWITDFRNQIDNGTLKGPRLFVAGPIFTAPGGHPVATFGVDPESDFVRLPASPSEARHTVRELAEGKHPVDLIKVVQDRGGARFSLEPILPDILRAIVDEANVYDLSVTAHWGTLEDLEDVIAAGVHGLEHFEPRGIPEGWPDGILDIIIEQDIPLTPTLTVTDAAVNVPPEIHSQLRERVGEFHTAAGRVVTGSDAPMQGVGFGEGIHRELELLVKSGFTAHEALKAATSEAAKVLKSEKVGVIKAGYAADLVATDGEPFNSIEAARGVIMVFRDGSLVVDNRDKRDTR